MIYRFVRVGRPPDDCPCRYVALLKMQEAGEEEQDKLAAMHLYGGLARGQWPCYAVPAQRQAQQ